MTKVSRRDAIQGGLAALAAGRLARTTSQATIGIRRPVSNKPAGIKLALIHAATDSESNEHPGDAIMGKVLAIGYMKGIMDAWRLRYT